MRASLSNGVRSLGLVQRTPDRMHSAIKRLGWPIALSAAVVALTGRASPLVDSFDAPVSRSLASFAVSPFYVAGSPVFRWLDTITLLSVPQTIWLFVEFAMVVMALSPLWHSRRGHALLSGIFFLVLRLVVFVAIVEGAVIALPRPVAWLEAADPDVVRVDFHSHTNASRDANKRFTPELNRDWHTAGGFDVAYITDHVRFGGAAKAMSANPAHAGDGLVVLSGMEGRYHRILSTILLGVTAGDTVAIDRKGHLLPKSISLGLDPVAIVAIPNGNIDSVSIMTPDSLPHFEAIELVDAAPRGLRQLDGEESRIRHIAAAKKLLLVASSNNHGWGHAVAAWNLLTIPGWRRMSPDLLERAIEQPFRDRQLDAVAIVKRLRPRNHGYTLPFVLPNAAYLIVGSLSPIERISWLLWIWMITGLAYVMRSRHVSTRS